MGALCRSKLICLSQLVDAAGPALSDSQALGSVLGVRSVRLMQRGLELWKRRLTEREKVLLLKHSRGEAEPNPTDPYPEIHLCPGFTELSSPLLKHTDEEKLSLQKAEKKTLHNVKTRLSLEFCFHRITENIDVFEQQWAHEELLCRVNERELEFASFLN
ncbi:hypothetical protein ABVT39_011906 [Epinephelus coioides]